MKKKTIFTLLLTVLMVMMFSSVVVSARTRIMPGVQMKLAKGEDGWNYGMNLGLPGKAKIGTPSYSAVVLLPPSLLAKNNTIAFEGRMDLLDPTIKNGDQYRGTAPSSLILINVSNTGKITVERRKGYGGKKISMGSAKVSVKKSADKKFYVLKIQNMPLDTTYFPKNAEWEEKNKLPISTKKAFKYSMQFQVSSWGKIFKAVKDCFYIDTCSLNVAKTLKMNFTGNFQNFDSWCWHQNKEARPVRKIARVKYS